jgi:tRNA-Thr(GGU) m(6)t(6)A37 methyltransferase TsaA
MRNCFVSLLLALVETVIAAETANVPITSVKVNGEKPQFTVVPIGRIEREGRRTFIRLESRHQDGLLGLEEWSHVWVFYWFDRNDTPEKRAVLQVHPRGNRANPLTGVFATRSPMRPNLVALNLCRVVSIHGTDVEIESSDAFDHTPVIDLKPYIPSSDNPSGEVKTPKWIGP